MAGLYSFAALAMVCAVVASAATTPPPAADCSVPFNDLMPCIDYVNSNSSEPPSTPCCTAFSSTQKQHPVCLCQLQAAFADPATAPGNVTRADEISKLCKVAVDYSKCPAILGFSAPAPSPTLHSPPPHQFPPNTPTISPIHAPTPAPGPVPLKGSDYDCSNSTGELANCLEFVSGDGKAPPPKECCTAIGSVQAREPVCICQLFSQMNDSAQYGINATLAQSLPQLCKVSADMSRCPALLDSPIGSILAPSPFSPATAPVAPWLGPTPAHAPILSPSSPAPTPVSESVDCSNEFASLQSCLAYAMANDTTPPTPECCTSLGAVVKNKPVCLCQLLQTVGSGDPATAGINATRALGLPAVCNVITDVDACPTLLGQPVSSPLPSAPSDGGSPSPTGADDSAGEAPAPARSASESLRVTSALGFATVLLGFILEAFRGADY